MRVRNIAARLGLASLLILLATVPLLYQYSSSVASVKAGSGKATTALDFASVPENPSEPGLVLAYAALASQSAREGNYTEARRLLGLTGKLSQNIEHDLRTYVTLTNELLLILDSIKSQLDLLQVLVSDGAMTKADETIQGIESLIADGSRHLDLLVSSLDRIEAIYHVDISTQRQDLEVFLSALLSFEGVLSKLKVQVDAMDSRTITQLDLAVSPDSVLIENPVRVSGRLQGGGAELGGRVVELWINGIKTANLTLDELGMFQLQYLVPSGMRVDELEVHLRYFPVGDDIPRFRPARSTTATVTVNYFPVVLTITVLPSRVLVLENFTVQGYMADSLGRALPMQPVNLFVDGESIGDFMTDSAGMYRIGASLPAGTQEGDHKVYVLFVPRDGIYASAASDTIAIQLYYIRPTVSRLIISGVAIVGGEPVGVSGQMAQLGGLLEIDSRPFNEAEVIAVLAGNELGRSYSGADGTFRIPIRIPLDASDQNRIEILVVPARPWVAPATATIVLTVFNSAVIGMAAGATVFGILALSGKTIDVRSVFRRRAPMRRYPKAGTVVPVEPEMKGGESTIPIAPSLSDFKIELDVGIKLEEPRAYVRTVYWEIRALLVKALDTEGMSNETAREYQARVLSRLGATDAAMSGLTRLFELAEYSQHTISRSEAEEGRDHAFRVAEQMYVRIKS